MRRRLANHLLSGGPLRAAVVLLALGAAVGATALTKPLLAQTGDKPAEPAPAPPNPQPWTVTCNGQGASGTLVCVMTQGLIAKNTGQRVLSVAISKTQAGGYSATFSLPHGLNLPEGIEVWIDEGARTKHAIATADQNGSYATVPLDQAMVGAMRRGTILNVSVKSASGDAVIFQLSLSGFTAALERL